MTLTKPSAEKAGTTPPEAQQWIEVLSNGERVSIRPIHKQDLELERSFLTRLSPKSRRLRFLDTINSPSDELLNQLVDIDLSRDVAFVALTVGKATEQEIGVARLCGDPDGRTAEFAVTVSDEWQRLGVGTRLMRHLMDSASDAANNAAMRGFARHLGCNFEMDPNDSTQVLNTLLLRPVLAVQHPTSSS
jgi:GNAT superfamily N-acetyltransferase